MCCVEIGAGRLELIEVFDCLFKFAKSERLQDFRVLGMCCNFSFVFRIQDFVMWGEYFR